MHVRAQRGARHETAGQTSLLPEKDRGRARRARLGRLRARGGAASPQNEAVAPEHRARELLPLSISTLDGDTLWVFTLTLTKDQSFPFILVT